MPLPPGVPDWVYPSNRVLTRLAGRGNHSGVWLIQAVEAREDGLHVRMSPPDDTPGVLPGWFPIEWVLDNCYPVNAASQHVTVPMEPREVLLSLSGEPPQRFLMVGLEVADVLRITLEQELDRGLTARGLEQYPAPDEDVFGPQSNLGWFHPGRVIVFSDERDTEEGLPANTDRRPRWVIEEMWVPPSDEGLPTEDPIVRIRELGRDTQEVHTMQDILENFTHTELTAEPDGLPALATGAPEIYAQLLEVVNQFGEMMRPLVGVMERLASSFNEIVTTPGFEAALRIALTENGEEPPVNRRTLFERILDEEEG